MTHYNSSNVKLSNSQLNKLISPIKNEIEVLYWKKFYREEIFPVEALPRNF